MRAFAFVAAVLISVPFLTFASSPVQTIEQITASKKHAVVQAFRYYKNISPDVSVPTVIEATFRQESFSLPVFSVYNVTTSEFEPYVLSESVIRGGAGSQIEAIGAVGSPYAISDGNYETYVEFPVREGGNRAEVRFTFSKPIAASSVSFALDNYVALPQTITITTYPGAYTVLASTRLSQQTVTFPKTTSATWHVAFDYVQPLRISEMKFDELSAVKTNQARVRFLAQPGQSYQIYFDADRYVPPVSKEAGDFFSSTNAMSAHDAAIVRNPEYTPVDSDSDSFPDLTDNCTDVSNNDQKDSDGNGRGDACEDYDSDNIISARDNCPAIPNRDQKDTDNDGMGDVCDTFENRVTERLPWLPWLGIGFAGLVLLGMFFLAIKHKGMGDTLLPPPGT